MHALTREQKLVDYFGTNPLTHITQAQIPEQRKKIADVLENDREARKQQPPALNTCSTAPSSQIAQPTATAPVAVIEPEPPLMAPRALVPAPTATATPRSLSPHDVGFTVQKHEPVTADTKVSILEQTVATVPPLEVTPTQLGPAAALVPPSTAHPPAAAEPPTLVGTQSLKEPAPLLPSENLSQKDQFDVALIAGVHWAGTNWATIKVYGRHLFAASEPQSLRNRFRRLTGDRMRPTKRCSQLSVLAEHGVLAQYDHLHPHVLQCFRHKQQ